MKISLPEVLAKYQYISFDVFDTLLIRKSGKPETVFENAGKRLKEMGIYDGDFLRVRTEAQEAACRNEKVEPTLDDIYENIKIPGLDIEQCKKIEIEEENKELIPNDFLKKIIHELRLQGKTVIITSDMYLSAATISELLQRKGFEFDHIFVSSEYQQRKSRGGLYNCVIKELGIKKNQLLHIGDNQRSDYLIPSLKGIKAIHWKGIQS